MVVTVQLIGGFRQQGGSNKVSFPFKDPPSLSEVIDRSIDWFKERGILIDKDYMMASVDGHVVARSSWPEKSVDEGQVCSLFPPLAGG